jgi:hypothetical protein
MSTASTGNFPHKFELPKGTPPEIIAVIENAARNAIDHHGVPAFEMSRNAAIAHEAGHVIVAAHEGVNFQSVRIFSRSMPPFGEVWGGWCAEEDGKEWTTGPDTSAESDLSRARIIVAGLAGEAACRLDKPGSSLDELVLSQVVGHNAAAKLYNPTLSDAEFSAYEERLWHEQVWGVAVAILCANRKPFMRLADHLHQHERIKGGKLRNVLAQVRRIAP